MPCGKHNCVNRAGALADKILDSGAIAKPRFQLSRTYRKGVAKRAYRFRCTRQAPLQICDDRVVRGRGNEGRVGLALHLHVLLVAQRQDLVAIGSDEDGVFPLRRE